MFFPKKNHRNHTDDCNLKSVKVLRMEVKKLSFFWILNWGDDDDDDDDDMENKR